MKRHFAIFLVVLTSYTLTAMAAETFPNRPLRIVVGFTPGTTTDITARLLADRLSNELGQSVIVENRPGANSGLANQLVASATPDGYTMLMGTLSLVTAPMLYRSVPFNPRALVPVSLLITAANVICVYPGLPIKSLPELIDTAKARPGKLRYGSSGRGSSAFLTLELLKSMAGIDIQEIPYKATSQAVTDTMAGQIDVYPPNIVSAIRMLKTGRLRPLAVTSVKRSSALPDIPAVAEFVRGYDATTGIYGILVPKGTPKAILSRLNRAIVTVTREPDFKGRLERSGGEVIGSSPQEYATYLAAQRTKWGGLFKQLGIKPE